MKIRFTWNEKTWQADLSRPLSLGLPLNPAGTNPNCYGSEPPRATVIRAGDFVGSVAEGGPVNHLRLCLSPHGNGTHTECYGHITASGATIADRLQQFWFIALLVSLTPTRQAEGQVIGPELLPSDWPVGLEALVVRTLPNGTDKRRRNYSGTNPPWFLAETMQKLVKAGIQHLVCDLPSVDKEEDGGRLAAHRAFWQTEGAPRTGATITELAFIDNRIADGLYLLNLQVPAICLDAAPSRPVLYALEPAGQNEIFR